MKEEYKYLDIIADVISNKNSIKAEEIFLKSRRRELADMRACFFYFSRKYTLLSFIDIGMYSLQMGRDKPHHHATVIHNVEKVKAIKSIDKSFNRYIKELEEDIKFKIDYLKSKKNSVYEAKSNIMHILRCIEDEKDVFKLNDIMMLIHYEKEALDLLGQKAREEIMKKNESIENERLYQTTSQDNGLGVV
jgi:hypothetical protein